MEMSDISNLLHHLDGSIGTLEEALNPFLNNDFSATTAKLPLLDKAKLHALIAYAIESILFSSLKLNGVEAKEHPIFTELTRVKQYFDKIKKAETHGPRSHTLDKQAVHRFITHGLAGNDNYEKERAATESSSGSKSHIRFEQMTERVGSHQRFDHLNAKRKSEDSSNDSQAPDEDLVKGNATGNGNGNGERRKKAKSGGKRQAEIPKT